MEATKQLGHHDDWLMRMPEVCRITGLSKSTVYEAMARGKFPKPVPLYGRSKAWSAKAVAGWVNARITAAQVGAHS